MTNEELYFNDELAYSVWNSKYRLNNETIEEFFNRIAKEFARLDNFALKFDIDIDSKPYSDLSSYGKERLDLNKFKLFLDLFKDFRYIIPGGSVLSGIGSDKPVSLSNCFVVKTDDSLGPIFDAAKDMAEIYKRRGGVGLDLSILRPDGASVNNAAKTTSGVVPFMELYSQVTHTIGQSGRRGALMLSIDINHPDSPEFVKVKQNLDSVTGANVSVRLNKDFINAAKNDEDYILRWPCIHIDNFNSDIINSLEYNKLTKVNDVWNESGNTEIGYLRKVKAKELWDSIIHCAWNSAEPGVLFWDTILNNDPASVYEEFKAVSTNPCVTPETSLLTKTGFTPIIEWIGEEIEIWNGNEWTIVTPFKTSDNEEVFKVTFSDGSDLTCTSYHEFILSDKKRKQLKDLKVGDKLAKFTYPLIESLTKQFEHRSDIFYTQGFFSGDGTIAVEEGRTTRYFIDLYGEKIKLLPNLIVREYGEYDKVNNKIRTEIDSLLVKNKDFVPNSLVFSIENRLQWLAGILDSDGTLNDSGGSLAISSIDKEFLLNIKSLLITLGIRSTIGINKEEQEKEIKGKTYNCQTCYRLVLSAFSVKQLMDLGLKTYRIPLIANPNRDASRFIQIESIQSVGYSDVYCVTDNKNHSALFNHVMTGQCGEIPLSPYDSCRLIATNLYSLVENPFTEDSKISFDKAYKVFYEAQIIADILVDLEAESVQKIIDITHGSEQELWIKIKEIGLKGRRTGTGITGLGDMLAALNLPYNDFIFIDEIMHLKMEAELDATIDLAILNGSFPVYNQDLEWYSEFLSNNVLKFVDGKNQFFKKLKIEFVNQSQRMYEYGRRNISWSTIAPTGTISILAGTTSGCEPVFSLYYTRRKKCNPGETVDFIDVDGIGFKNYNVVHPKFKEWYYNQFIIPEKNLVKDLSEFSKEELDELIKTSPWYNNTSADIKPEDRVKVQSILQKYTTHSISSTVNLPKETTEEDIRIIYEKAYSLDCKGITCYRENSRSGILIKQEESKSKITERPSELTCKVVRFKNERKNWIAFVGIIDGKAYEIFSGVNDIDELPIPSYIEIGKIIKIREESGSRYDFSYIDKYGYNNTVGGLNRIFDKEFWNYARFVSALLREGVPVENIINIIEKLEFTNKGMNNWKSGIIRSLKVFIPDGTEAIGASCDNCGSKNIVYESGCMICRDCGSSHCN